MSRIWSSKDGKHLIHAEDLAEVRSVCTADAIPFETELAVGNKTSEAVLAELIDMLSDLIPAGNAFHKRLEKLQLLARAVRDDLKTVAVPEWRPLWEGETVFLRDPIGRRQAHDVKDLSGLPRGLIAVEDNPKEGLRVSGAVSDLLGMGKGKVSGAP